MLIFNCRKSYLGKFYFGQLRPIKALRELNEGGGGLVCVICNCKIYIQTLHNDVTHIEDGCAPPILCTFVK